MDWVLVHVGADSSTVAIVRGAQVMFFRNRPADAEGHLNDLVHQSAMYYEDRLGGPGLLARARHGAGRAGRGRGDRGPRNCIGGWRSGPAIAWRCWIRGAAAGIAHGGISPSPELLSALAAPVGVVLARGVTSMLKHESFNASCFYNERAVHWGLPLAFVAIAVLTVFNVTRVIVAVRASGDAVGRGAA